MYGHLGAQLFGAFVAGNSSQTPYPTREWGSKQRVRPRLHRHRLASRTLRPGVPTGRWPGLWMILLWVEQATLLLPLHLFEGGAQRFDTRMRIADICKLCAQNTHQIFARGLAHDILIGGQG